MTAYLPDAARDAAITALPPGACPLLTAVHQVAVRSDPAGEWTTIEYTDSDPRATTVSMLMLSAVNDAGITRFLDAASLRTDYRHLQPCPLCDHTAAPGPRVWGLWLIDSLAAAERHQGWRGISVADLEVFASAAYARSRMYELAARWVRERERNGDRTRAETLVLTVPADPARRPDYQPRVITATSELWLWEGTLTSAWSSPASRIVYCASTPEPFWT